MSLGLNGSNENQVEAGYRALRIIWLAILATVIALFVVTRLAQPVFSDGNKMLLWILLVMGFCTLAASFIVKQKLLSQSISKQRPEMVRSAYIIAYALCEATGLFGLMVYFVTGIEYYYFFFVLSGFGIILHKPQRDDLLAASGAEKFPIR